jgi:hypothetical protein
VAGFVDQLGDVEQGFGGDTAAIKANSAGVEFRVDERDFHSEVGSEERGGIATRASADYCDV